LVSGYPDDVGRVWLFVGGVVSLGDLECLLWLLFIASKEAFKLSSTYGRQDLGTIEGVIIFGQLLTDLDGKDGWGGGGIRRHRRTHRGGGVHQIFFAEMDAMEELLALYCVG
jgi:hypothetical protein